MTADRNDTQAASLYDRWVYPEPVADLDAYFAAGRGVMGDPSTQFFNIWPDREKFAPRILVPGCGSFLAAALAMRNPDSDVVGIDLSKECLAHSRKLKAKHKLSNLELRQLDLRDVKELGAPFDYILVAGVLHHLPDPVAGLKSLAGMLAENGVVAVLDFGQATRAGVYMLRDAFQAAGLKGSAEDIELVRQTIANLPEGHAARRFTDNSADIQSDGGIYHNFLSPEDCAYTVGELFDMLGGASLQFQDWFDRGNYHPMSELGQNHPLFNRVMSLNSRDQAVAVDNLTQRNGIHRLYARRASDGVPTPVDWSDAGTLDLVPHLHPALQLQREQTPQGARVSMSRGGRKQYPNDMLLAFVQSINGKRSIRACLDFLVLQGAKLGDDSQEAALHVFHQLYSLGHIMIERGAKRPA
jgi:SAM-dependent methyltransferase